MQKECFTCIIPIETPAIVVNSLSNLRSLWASENLAQSDSWEVL